MKEPKRIKSKFAILDVEAGRVPLRRHFGVNAAGRRSNRMASNEDPIPVTIHGHIVRVWGADDGTSQEFEVRVDRAVLNG